MSIKTLPLAYPELKVDTNIAVVGSSAILLDDFKGEEIDNFNCVVRFNRAPTEGFKQHVGSKTTIRCCNPHVFANKEFKGQDQYFVKKQKDCSFVVIGPENRHLKFEDHVPFIDDSCTAHKVDISKAYIGFRAQPTVGICFITLLVRAGINPTVYGFYGLPGKEGREGLTHYWHERENKSVCHSYDSERDILNTLHNNGLINWVK